MMKPEACRSCFGACWGMSGYVPASGTGDNGVLILGEAAGANEAADAQGFIGKAGHFLFQNLQRAGIDREGFKLDNVIACQPGPKNWLAGAPYEEEVIKNCKPHLEATIQEMKEKCRVTGKHLTILTMGKIPFKAIMGFKDKDPIMTHDYLAYPFWSTIYNCYVIPSYHPSYLMRGNTHLVPTMQFAATRALEIAKDGVTFAEPNYLLDPNAALFEGWIEDYFRAYEADPTLILSYDIETPMKQGANEEDVAKEDDDDYTILRCSFSYRVGEGVSVVWDAEHRPALEKIFAHPGTKCGWNNFGYDRPRILAQMPINGDDLDSMLMWHVLNSSLPKGLGFVAPYYAQTQPCWKYLADTEPAKYNAIDSDVTLQCVLGIKAGLIKGNLWDVYTKHVTEVHKIFNYMGSKGVLIDQALRLEAEKKLQTKLDDIEAKMDEAVPQEVRKLKVFKKTPKDTTGMIEVDGKRKSSKCPGCSAWDVKTVHFKSIGKKKLKAGGTENICLGLKAEKVEVDTKLWAQPLEFKVSKVGLGAYQKFLRHQAVVDRKKGKITFDEKAILQLVRKYPKDPLYPKIIEFRGTQKLLSTYVGVTQLDGRIRGGLPLGLDGRVHTIFTSNPSTLRSASQTPNLQNIPRSSGAEGLASLIRNFFIAAPGNILTARDFSGIEAKLVGYFAGDPDYIRLCAIDVHSFYTAYAINYLDGRIKSYDLPLLSWDDERLRNHLAGIKKEFKADRNNLYKHLIHAKNFGQKARGAQEKILLETGINFPLKDIQKVMDLYDELFPKIHKWQWNTLLQVEKDGFLRNPFGYVHRFNRPFDYEKFGREWQKKQGVDANKIWAFLPQSTAAGMIKEAMMRLFYTQFEEVGQYLRLLIHDELFLECPEALVDEVDATVALEMERPVPEMPLPASFGIGSHLMVGTEGKRGYAWGSMR